MQKHILTSFSARGYEQYGRRFLEEYKKHISVPLVLYLEPYGDTPAGLPEKSYVVSLAHVPGWPEFEKKLANFPIMRGQVEANVYSIQYDARMARKAFIQAHAAQEFGCKVFWLDADVRIFADVPEAFFDEVLPDDKFCCFLGREGGPIAYTETGFLGFNAQHNARKPFMQTYRRIFEEGLIFTQAGWHDCYAFDMARKTFARGIFNDLGYGAGVKASHVFINSVLGRYFDHLKGPRKELGRSLQRDLVQPRSEEYWQEAPTEKEKSE